MANYEGKSFRILSKGNQASVRGLTDMRVVNTDGKTVWVKGVPREYGVGDSVYLKDYQESPGRADFAMFAGVDDGSTPAAAQPAADTGRGTPTTVRVGQTQGATSVDAQADLYYLTIGTSEQADDSAMAKVPADVLDMKPYDAVVYLLDQKRNDKGVFEERNDRRLADNLYTMMDDARKAEAMEEVVFTLAGRPLTTNTPGTLRDYFEDVSGKLRASASVGQGDQSGGATAKPAAGGQGGGRGRGRDGGQPKAQQRVHRAAASATAKGRPGQRGLEYIV